jgi:hypothetical protein
MAYNYENTTTGTDLIINGFENGIADSPFNGIGNIQNMNVSYIDGIAYVNYKRRACVFNSGTLQRPISYAVSDLGLIYIADFNGTSTSQVWKQDSVNGTSFTLLGGATYTTQIYNIEYWQNYLIVFRSNYIEICGDGGGDSGIISGNWNTSPYSSTTGSWPLKITQTVTCTTTEAAGATSATISSYNDGSGTPTVWNGATGTYFASFSGTFGSQTCIANMTQGQALFTFSPALNTAMTSTNITVFLYGSTQVSPTSNKQSLVSINDGNMYFTNGNNVGAFTVPSFTTMIKKDFKTFRFNAAALGLPRTDGAICLTEIRNLLLVGAYHKIYPWDRISSQWQNPIPLQENIFKMINILNTVYIVAGFKGNIYYSNGYNADLLKKIPDTITGVVDPKWVFGDVMENRNNLYFQASAVNSSTGNRISTGIYKLDLGTDNKALTMDSQYSGGLDPAGLRTDVLNSQAYGLLINNNNIQPLDYDNYYSAYAATTSSVDYNGSQPWENNEPLIETDIIPVGTFFNQKTFSSIEFKLDQPMTSGDSITIYARQSLSDTYQLVGTTSTAVLSNSEQKVAFEKWQWLQLKITTSTGGSATLSSRVRIREIRIHQ